MSDLTALQTILQSPEAAQELLDHFEGAEDEHHLSDSDAECRWEISIEVWESDLPKLREELREYANDEQ